MSTKKRSRVVRRSSSTQQDSDSEYVPSPDSPNPIGKPVTSSVAYIPKAKKPQQQPKRQRHVQPAVTDMRVSKDNFNADDARRRNTSQWCAIQTTDSVRDLRQLAKDEGIPNSSDASKREICTALQKKMGITHTLISSYEDDADSDIPTDLQDAFTFKLLVDPYVAMGGESYNQSTLYELSVRQTANHHDNNQPFSKYVIRNNHIKRMAEQWAIEHGLNLTALRAEEKAEVQRIKQLEIELQKHGGNIPQDDDGMQAPQQLPQELVAGLHDEVVAPRARRGQWHGGVPMLHAANGLLHRLVDYAAGPD